MIFRWLKQYLPRGLYGRAALILMLPVVTIQLVVFVLFAQRHFTEVTEQMTRAISGKLALVFEAVDTAPDATSAAIAVNDALLPLGIRIAFVPASDVPDTDISVWYEFTGTVFSPLLRESFPQIERILLDQKKTVTLYAASPHGPMQITFARDQISPARPHQLYVNMVFFGFLMTVIAFLYLRNQLRPITRLSAAAEAFGRGRYMPYTPAGALEVRAAGTAFVDMRSRIDRHIEQRTLLLSGVSHDLRTPLTRLRLGLSMLDDDERLPLEQDVEDMQRLVDEFLNFVKGAGEGRAEPTDPFALITHVVADAERSGLDVSLGSIEGTGEIALRKVAIRRAIDNLITNAVRYGSRAEISVALTDKSLRIRVEDDGPGIPADQRAEAVKPFMRLDAARNQDRGAGVGLGLAIATDIARAHGGVLRLGESARLGGLCADIVIAR